MTHRVLLALLMSAVPALFSASMPGMEMKSAARRTVSTLQLARESAIRQGRDEAGTLRDSDLRAIEIRHLKEAFRAVRDAQEGLALKYRTDRF